MAFEPSARRRPRRERRSRRLRTTVTWLGGLVLLALVFFAGFLLARVEDESEDPAGTRTLVRTLEPTTLTPPATVTVTVSNP
jgi:hypothetical protein